jgi:hypothetical protein
MNRILNKIATSNTLFSMIDIQDLLHSMISMTCIWCYSFNFVIRILSFVNMSIIIIMNLNHQHQLLSLLRFVHLNLHQLVNHFKHLALRINTHVWFFYSIISFRMNIHAHFHLSQIFVSASTFRDLTLYASTSIISQITKSFFKKFSRLNKIYTIDEKFTSTDDNFDFKLRIFFNKCKRVELSSHAYMKKTSFMFAKRALFYF